MRLRPRRKEWQFAERDYLCVCGENMTDQLRRRACDNGPWSSKRKWCPDPIMGTCSQGHYCEYQCTEAVTA